MEKKYIPISCSFYDELEALATLKKSSTIIYKEEQEVEVEVNAKIIDFYIKNKIEFMQLDNGAHIRLDTIIRVNGKILGNYC